MYVTHSTWSCPTLSIYRRISYGESPQKSGLARKALLIFSTDTRFKMKLYLLEFNISSIHFASLKLNF